MKSELKVIQDFYDFLLWMIEQIAKFPRNHRHSLGVSIENRLQEIMADLIRARYRRDRISLLERVNVEMEVLRFQLRLASDLKVLSIRGHGFAAKSLVEVGSQVGGWLKASEKKR